MRRKGSGIRRGPGYPLKGALGVHAGEKGRTCPHARAGPDAQVTTAEEGGKLRRRHTRDTGGREEASTGRRGQKRAGLSRERRRGSMRYSRPTRCRGLKGDAGTRGGAQAMDQVRVESGGRGVIN